MTSQKYFLNRDEIFRWSKFSCAAFAVLLASVVFGGSNVSNSFVAAQTPSTSGSSKIGGSSYLHQPSLPTGELATFRRIGSPKAGQIQPVEWKLPEGCVVGVATDGGYVQNRFFGLALGSVYRFQITNVPFNPGRTLYPTLEIVGTLNPPAGREWDFPIEIVVPQEDLDLALKANLVTRVVFVEDSENAANVDSSNPGQEITIDASLAVDPVAVAETRGRAVAILRMGSREPVGTPNARDPFYFGLPRFEFKPFVVSDVAPKTETTTEEAASLETVDETRTVETVESRDGDENASGSR